VVKTVVATRDMICLTEITSLFVAKQNTCEDEETRFMAVIAGDISGGYM
jgi:hypothetical protein